MRDSRGVDPNIQFHPRFSTFKMGKNNEETQRALKCEAEEGGIYYLSGKKPFFDVVLSRSQWMPSSIVSFLPRAHVIVVLQHGGKNWKVGYTGHKNRPGFESRHWKTFVIDNHLKLEDGLVFELMDNNLTALCFKVHILRNQWSPDELAELEARGINYHGDEPETPFHVVD